MKAISNYSGRPGTTVTFTASADTAYSLTDMLVDLIDVSGRSAYMILISFETNPVRVSFTADASQTLGHYRTSGEAFQVEGVKALATLTIANATAGDNFTAQITPFFINY